MENRSLYKIAFISSPLLGLITMMPGLIFGPGHGGPAGPDGPPNPPGPTPVMVGAFFATMSILIWILNIELIKLFQGEIHKHKTIRYVISFLLVLSFTGFILIMAQPPTREGRGMHIPMAPFASSFLLNTIVALYIESVREKERKRQIEEENAQLREFNLMAKQQQLLNQLNPHFLFNSLSTVKSLVNSDPEKAEDYIIQLSEFLRTTLSQSQQNTLTLAQEIEFCEQYLTLQKLRFPRSFMYSIHIPEEIRNQYKLPVFTLQSMAENAIKHNAFTSNKPLKLEIFVNPEGEIEVANNKNPKPAYLSTGIGLSNLTERYRLLGIEQGIRIREDNERFIVHVKLLPL